MRRLPRIALSSFLLVATLYAGGVMGVWYAGQQRRQVAEAYVALAQRLSDPRQSFIAAKRQYSIPAALMNRDEAIRYYLLSASEIDEDAAGANYFLGLHFLSRDCWVAQYYFARQLDLHKNKSLLMLVQRIRREGCAAVAAELDANRIPNVD